MKGLIKKWLGINKLEQGQSWTEAMIRWQGNRITDVRFRVNNNELSNSQDHANICNRVFRLEHPNNEWRV